MDNLPTRNNNPGDLRDTQTGIFNKYPTAQAGQDALINDLNIKINGQSKTGLTPNSTLKDFAYKWAPPSDNNDSEKYANDLASQLGVPVNTSIGALKNRVQDFASAISKNEGYHGNQIAGMEQNIPSEQTIPDNNNPRPKSILSHKQLIENINAMEQQGAKPEEIQGYLDSLKQNNSNQINYNNGIDSSDYVTSLEDSNQSNEPTSTIGKIGKGILGVINPFGAGSAIGEGIGTIAARQEAKQGIGPEGEALIEANYAELAKHPELIAKLKAQGVPTTSQEQRAETVSRIKGPSAGRLVGDTALAALQVAGPEIFGAATKGLGGLMRGADVLSSPAVETAMRGFDMPMEQFQALSNGDKAEYLSQALAGASTVTDKAVLQQALDTVLPAAIKEAGGNAPTLLGRIARKGGRIATDYLLTKLGLDSIRNLTNGLMK